jgi:GT2 family glycosyltransferase
MGFGKACNAGVREARGKFILFLNPDTLVQKESIPVLARFLDAHPEAGAVGPKILNPDGSLQLACRRSFPTPSVALGRLLCLSFLFPASKLWGRYNLTYLDPEEQAEVDAVSGSCMMVPKNILESIGGFDQDFFMYGEDLDLCYRIKLLHKNIYYTPSTQIIHFKGESSRQVPVRSFLSFYNAMFLFSRKHITTRHSFLPKWLLYLSILLNACMGFFRLMSFHLPSAVLDICTLNTVLFLSMTYWFRHLGIKVPYQESVGYQLFFLHTGFSLIWFFSLSLSGSYRNRQHWVAASIRSCLIAAFISLAAVYVAQQIAFSRAVFLITSTVGVLIIPGWRFLLDVTGAVQWIVPRPRVLLVGSPGQVRLLIDKSTRLRAVDPVGYLTDEPSAKIPGLENLGRPAFLTDIAENYCCTEVFIFEDTLSYSQLIKTISLLQKSKPAITLVAALESGQIRLTDLRTSSTVILL